jgi:hypothetical protein
MLDSILTLRCPYCTAGKDSKPMIAHKDGRFVCEQCAHTIWVGVPSYRCTCQNCLRWKRDEPR